MRSTLLLAVLTAAATGPLAAQHQHDPSHHAPAADSAFAGVQERGRAVMGVDQYTSRHVFESLAGGGRIELQRSPDDSAGVAQIRRHLREVAAQFRRGDFSAPFLVHDRPVPGTDVLSAHRTRLRYDVRDLPGGGEIRIHTRDAEALRAVHAFLAFQREDHRAAAH